MWLRNRHVQRYFGGGVIERMFIGAASRLELLGLAGHKDPHTLRLIRGVRRKRRSLVTANEAFLVHSLARAQANQPGVMAEVGVYQGGTAKMICEAKGDKPLHLFDTFEGLPDSSDADRSVHAKRQYACSLESVREYLNGYPEVYFHQGLFPGAKARALDGVRICFAHFDVDLYQSTRDCLEFFYPRMTAGGIMLSHDYSILSGVQQAFAEFLADKPEKLIELPSTQCMVIKLG